MNQLKLPRWLRSRVKLPASGWKRGAMLTALVVLAPEVVLAFLAYLASKLINRKTERRDVPYHDPDRAPRFDDTHDQPVRRRASGRYRAAGRAC
ncbi:MAG: hypothetical protein HQL53_08460 [Magnetococcales bacterium]|nr:hypothetical protein [Magnetococcales bacterium]